jgi:hypothetical protein
VLHYSLHIPEMWGIDHWGLWLLGGIAIIWTIDCFVGFYLTLPARRREAATAERSWWQRWGPAWRVRWSGGSTRLNFMGACSATVNPGKARPRTCSCRPSFPCTRDASWACPAASSSP